MASWAKPLAAVLLLLALLQLQVHAQASEIHISQLTGHSEDDSLASSLSDPNLRLVCNHDDSYMEYPQQDCTCSSNQAQGRQPSGVGLGSKKKPDSPNVVSVQKDTITQAVASRTTAYGEGLKSVIAGEVTNFTIVPRNTLGHPILIDDFSLLLRHNMSERYSKFRTDCKADNCIVAFLCIEAGPYQISLLLHGSHIHGSPFTVQILPSALNATRSIVMGPQHNRLRPFIWRAGHTTTFFVHPRDMFGNKVVDFSLDDLELIENVTVKGKEPAVTFQTQIVGDSRFQITANTTHTGNMSLSILVRNQHVTGSPFTVQIFPDEPQPHHTQAIGPSLWESSVGVESTVFVSVFDRWYNPSWNDAHIVGLCRSASSQISNCTVHDVINFSNGSFALRYVSWEEGPMRLMILLNGEHIAGSPFSINIKNAACPIPPKVWKFLGPFSLRQCFPEPGDPPSPVCSFEAIDKTPFSGNYQSEMTKSGLIGWKEVKANNVGRARVTFQHHEYVGWAVGHITNKMAGDHFVFCDGIDEYQINGILYQGGSWHQISLAEGTQKLIARIVSKEKNTEFWCDFMAVTASNMHERKAMMGVGSLFGDSDRSSPFMLSVSNQCWMSIIQLVVLYKCLTAVLGPLYYRLEKR